MTHGEQIGLSSSERRSPNRERTALCVASVAIIGALVGCSTSGATYESIPLPARNTPSEGSYSTNVSPGYFGHLEETMQATDDPEFKEKIEALKTQPIAEWLNDSTEQTFQVLGEALVNSEDSIPIIALYNIPNRDLGSFSRGGAQNEEEYRQWITRVSEAIGERETVVILEPDALPQVEDMSETEGAARISMLGEALDILHNNINTAVYLDLGNSRWLTPESAAALLKHVADASEHDIQGISLNVSNFLSEKDTEQFAHQVQKQYGQKLFVMIDNSRNGAPDAVPVGEWCNPPGQQLGEADAIFNPDNHIETAYIKTPGESDGECGPDQLPAGQFDPELLRKQLGE